MEALWWIPIFIGVDIVIILVILNRMSNTMDKIRHDVEKLKNLIK